MLLRQRHAKGYSGIFDEKEALTIEGIRKGKMIKQLQDGVESAVASFKKSEEYEENRAFDFM